MRILVCFFKILKKKRGYIFMYLGIFFSIAIAMSLQGGNSEKSYENQKISFCVFDEDRSEISRGLTDFLKKENEWVEVEDEEEVIQEKMYNRSLTCVVRIPKAFGETMGERETDYGKDHSGYNVWNNYGTKHPGICFPAARVSYRWNECLGGLAEDDAVGGKGTGSGDDISKRRDDTRCGILFICLCSLPFSGNFYQYADTNFDDFPKKGNFGKDGMFLVSENENIPGTVCFIYRFRFGAHSTAFNRCICHEERTLVYRKRWIVYRQRDRLFARYIKPRIFNQPAGHKN